MRKKLKGCGTVGVKTSWIYNFIHTVNKIIMTNNIIIKLLIKTKNGRESFAETPKILGAGGRKPPSSNLLLPCLLAITLCKLGFGFSFIMHVDTGDQEFCS